MYDFTQGNSREAWYRHPVIGDASFDTFERSSGNPAHRGSHPYEWPVNCSIFKDPVTGFLYIYVSRYPKGYWDVCFSLDSIAYESRDEGQTWGNLGVVLEGTTDGFDAVRGRKGSITDLSVVYHNGTYHAVAGWVCCGNTDGGITYACAESPRGPFKINSFPLHTESGQSLIYGLYTRAYAANLVKRENDWLILTMLSTKSNAGGTWALAAMTADRPEGPYSAPVPVLYPQSMKYHPPLMENFTYIEQAEDLYLPFTSVAVNRNFNVIYKVNREKAHIPEAWELYRHGSVWHSEDIEYERKGLWGQNFTGIINKDGCLVTAYPAKDGDDLGTINLAGCKWNTIDGGTGFYVSAPNGPGMTFIRKDYENFRLTAEIESNQKKIIFWGHNSPLGPNGISADVSIHPCSMMGMTRFEYHRGKWSLVRINLQGDFFEIDKGAYEYKAEIVESVKVYCGNNATVRISINDTEVFTGEIDIVKGRIGVLAETGCCMHITRFETDSIGKECMLSYLCTEGLCGAGEGYNTAERWSYKENSFFRFGMAYETDIPGSAFKWNYYGGNFRLWSPKGPELGIAEVYVDGVLMGLLDLKNDTVVSSLPVYTSAGIGQGYHAVVIKLVKGKVICDSFDFYT